MAENSVKLLRNVLIEERDRRTAAEEALDQYRRDWGSLLRHNRELRWQLTAALSRLSADDIYEVLAVTEGEDGG